jgi:hypothetical protein
MALPELDVARVQRWCAIRVPEHALDQVRVEGEIAPRHVTIVERRVPVAARPRTGMDELPHRPVALHRHREELDVVLARSNLRFHLYDRLAPSPNIDVLLDEIDKDPTCFFWG